MLAGMIQNSHLPVRGSTCPRQRLGASIRHSRVSYAKQSEPRSAELQEKSLTGIFSAAFALGFPYESAFRSTIDQPSLTISAVCLSAPAVVGELEDSPGATSVPGSNERRLRRAVRLEPTWSRGSRASRQKRG